MKEYKVLKPSLGLRSHQKKIEDLLNEHARNGWSLKSFVPHAHGISYIVFERNKNR